MMNSQHLQEGLPTHPHDSNRDYNWVAAFLILSVIEGCFGKWISPSLEYLPVVIRDLVGLAIIYRAIVSNRFSQHPHLTTPLLLWSIALTIFAVIQALVNSFSPVIIIIGLRFWILYFWITLAICCILREEDFRRLSALLITLSIWMTPLLIIQNASGPDAWINKATSEDALIFRLNDDVVRATGTFSFTSGFTSFLGLVGPILLAPAFALGNAPDTKGAAKVELFLFIIFVVCTLVSGSRAAMIFSIALFVCSLATSLITSHGSGQKNIAMAIVAIICALLTPVVLPETSNAIETRFVSANDSEDPAVRLRTVFVGSAKTWEDFTLGGEGLGLSANMTSHFLGANMAGTFMLSESEPERTLLAGGLFGLMWLAIKSVICLAGGAMAMKSAIFTRNALPILLWMAAAYSLTSWSITGQLSAQSLCAILLALAAASIGIVDKTRA